MNYLKIKFKGFTVYPINIGYVSEFKVFTNKMTAKYKAEIYTICV